MVITYKTLDKVRFPVYILPSGNWDKADGLLFLDGELVDDKNMPGDTLGVRRIQTPYKELMPLRRQLISPQGILKQKSKTFIDSNGTPFIYEKTKVCKLSYYKIKKVERKEVASILWLKGVNFPFTVPRPPEDGMTWAGVLHFHGLPWMLYEYSENKKPDTRRKI
jgi:hypothetical protein